MSDFLDIGSFIEQTVQEVLGNDEEVSVAPRQDKPALAVDGQKVFRIGQTQGDLSLQSAEKQDLGLVQESAEPAFIPEASDEPEHALPLNRRSFAANLWSGPSFFAAQILKKK